VIINNAVFQEVDDFTREKTGRIEIGLSATVDEFIPIDLGIAKLFRPAPGWRQLPPPSPQAASTWPHSAKENMRYLS
jgi:hypothetical protein